MTENKKANLRHHSFDGIQELDNDLPRWWVNLFIITSIFGGLYLVWYHSGLFPSKGLMETHKDEMAAQQKVMAESAKAAAPAAFDIASAAKDAELVKKGKAIYDSNCLACHGLGAAGVVGPNLTDDYWINGHTYEALTKVVSEGVPAKGMPAWSTILGPEKIQQVLVYIKGLQGTNPPNPKAPQGDPGTF